MKPERRTIRVVAYRGGGRSRIEERPVPEPGVGELLLRLHCCGLCGTDLYKIINDTVPAGTVLGHELVGDVAAVGADVASFAVGDRVVVPHHVACGECALCRRGAETQCPTFKENLLEPGGFSALVLVRPRAVARAARRVPDGVGDEAAAFMEPAACVLRGIDRAGLPGDGGFAVILGAGSMGLLHLLVLRAVRPELAVVVIDPLPERRRRAEALGAHAAGEPGQAASLIAEVSAGAGADVAFDTVGGSGPLKDAVDLLRPGGTAVLFAHARDGEPAGFELNPFFKTEKRLVTTYSGGLAEQARIAELLFSGRLDPSPLVTHRLPFAAFDEAVALTRSHQALKVLLRPEAI